MNGHGLTAGAAFVGGVISFLSPCVLPLAPGYVSMLWGITLEQLRSDADHGPLRKMVLLNGIAFVIGFSVVFIGLGASASWVGQVLKAQAGILTKLAGLVVIAFGLHLTGLWKIKMLYTEARLKAVEKRRGWAGSLLMGLAFAFGWTPCIGPILAGILALAAVQETLLEGVFLLSLYSLGLAVPFLLTAMSVSAFFSFYRKFRTYLRAVEIAAGALLITIGLLILTNNFTRLASYLPALEIGTTRSSVPPPAGADAATRDDDDRGRPAPDLQLVDLEGRSVSLASLRGKVVIVDFWTTWCPPCVMEVPTFKKLQTMYRDKGLEIIAISLDEDKRDLAEFIRKNDLTYTVVLGDENLAEKFGPLTGLPMTYFIDRKGRIRIEHAGFMDYENFAHEVERLLAEPR